MKATELQEFPIEIRNYILDNYDLDNIDADNIVYYTIEEAEECVLEIYEVPDNLVSYVDTQKIMRDLSWDGYWDLVDSTYYLVNM